MFRGPTDAEVFRTQVGRFKERFYIDPLPGCDVAPAMPDEIEAWPSVSTVKKAAPKDFSIVTARRVADFAIENLAAVHSLIAAGNADAARDLLVGADKRGLNEAGERGTSVHEIMEALYVDPHAELNMLDVHKDAIPYVPSCRAFMVDVKPELVYAETVAISRTIGYGGTFDAVVIINGELVMIDYKSRKEGKHAVYEEDAWQIGAYAKADYWIVQDDDGAPKRIVPPDIKKGYLISVCPWPGSYRIYPIDVEEGFKQFISLYDLWHAKHIAPKAYGRMKEIAPRLYVPDPATLAAAAAAAEPAAGEGRPAPGTLAAPAVWDPFADDGSEQATSAPVAPILAEPRPEVPVKELRAAADLLVGRFVRVTWIERMAVGGQVHEAEQVAEAWLVKVENDVLCLDNSIGVPLTAKGLVAEEIEAPKPVGVTPINDALDNDEGKVEPQVTSIKPAWNGSVVGGGVVAQPGNLEIRRWLRRRLEADVEALGGQSAVLRYWPKTIKTLDKNEQNVHTQEELDTIERALTNLERDLQLPFGETKPGTAVAPERPDLGLTTEEAETAPVPTSDAPAHPDDVAMMVTRVQTMMARYPETMAKVVVPLSKDAGIPNLRSGRVTEANLLALDKIISAETMLVERRKELIQEGMAALDPAAAYAIGFGIGTDTGFDEPTESFGLRFTLLTDAYVAGNVVIEGDALVLSEAHMALAKEVLGEHLLAKANLHLVEVGFNSQEDIEALRRYPVGVLLAMHHSAQG